MGLNHPQDLEAWRSWARPYLARRIVGSVRRSNQQPETLILRLTGSYPKVVVALDSSSPSTRAALLAPVQHLGETSVAYLGSADVLRELGLGELGAEFPVALGSTVPAALSSVRQVLSTGHYLPAGYLSYQWAVAQQWEFVVVQHGLLTPHAPPLPSGSTVISFTNADGEFWQSGREDIAILPLGSQAMWEAAQSPVGKADRAVPGPGDSSLIFLGQMHGRELGRRQIISETIAFLQNHSAVTYRPHPQERDVMSRGVHRMLQRRGTAFDTSRQALTSLGTDVVSVFSTGVVEAVAQGRRGWVVHRDPPPWLVEFWNRYGMTRWQQGVAVEDQTPPQGVDLTGAEEPAHRIAVYLEGRERP